MKSWFPLFQINSTTGRVRFPIAYKLALVISLLIVTVMSVLGLLIISNQEQMLEEQMFSFGNNMAHQMAETTKEPILANDQLALNIVINNITNLKNIDGAIIFSENSTILASKGLVPSNLASNNQIKTGLTTWGDGMLAFVAPVRFQNLTAGYVLLSMNSSPLNEFKRKTINTITSLTLLMVLLGTAFSIVLGKRISRPIEALIDGSKSIHAGDYNFRFAEQRNDEIGLLMKSLNGLTQGLIRKEQVEKAFSKYVSPQVAKTVLNDLERIQLGGSRVYATVLFADIVGFTNLSESMEPYEVNELLNEYFSLIDHIAITCKGHVDKFMGDCAMLVFGTPDQDEKHVQHAMECATLIHQAVDTLNHKRKKEGKGAVKFRIGINSGNMLAGNTGSERRMDYTVVGDAVNLASRLSGVANAGETIVSAHLFDTTDMSSYFETAFGESIKVRGGLRWRHSESRSDCPRYRAQERHRAGRGRPRLPRHARHRPRGGSWFLRSAAPLRTGHRRDAGGARQAN